MGQRTVCTTWISVMAENDLLPTENSPHLSDTHHIRDRLRCFAGTVFMYTS